MADVETETEVQSPGDLVHQLFGLVGRVLRRRFVLGGAFALAVVAFFAVPMVIKPIYQSETVLVYREGIQAAQLIGQSDAQRESPRQRNLRLREMLLARSTFVKIINELNLHPDTVATRGIQTAVDELRENTKCRVGEGDTFSIQFQGDDANTVFQVTKHLAASMIDGSSRYRLEQAEATKRFLEAQAKRTAEELGKKEKALAEFLAVHPEFGQDVLMAGVRTTGASVRAAERRESATDPAVDALQRQAERVRRRAEEPTAPAPAPTTDPELQRQIDGAEQELRAAEQDLTEKQARYTAQHPDVIAAERRAKAARAEVSRLKASLPSAPAPPPSTEEERARLRKQLATLRSAIADAKKAKDDEQKEDATEQSVEIVALETQWSALNREMDEVRTRHETIQSKLFRAAILAKVVASGQSNQMEVIDEAYLPKRPTSRGKRRIGAMGAMGIFMLGVMLALGLALLDDRLYDEADLRKLELGPLIHVTPDLKAAARGKRHA